MIDLSALLEHANRFADCVERAQFVMQPHAPTNRTIVVHDFTDLRYSRSLFLRQLIDVAYNEAPILHAHDVENIRERDRAS
jgi:hypothetical protein